MSALQGQIEEVVLLNPPLALNHDTRRIVRWDQPALHLNGLCVHMSPDVLHPPHLVRRDRAMHGKPCLCRVQYGDASRKGQDHAHSIQRVPAAEWRDTAQMVTNVSGAQHV